MRFVQGTESLWNSDAPPPSFPSVAALSNVEVIVIGGGLSGLTTALLLQREGLTTALLEQGRLGSGESGRTTAHITQYPDSGYRRIAADFGAEATRLVAESQSKAIQLIESLAREIPCDFERVSGFLYAERNADTEVLEQELEAAHAAGVTAHLLPRAPIRYDTAAAIEFPNQAQFHPVKYLRGLAKLYVEAGGVISEASHVRAVDDEAGRCRVRTDTWTAYAPHVVSVTDAPITGGGLLDTKLRANRSYALALRIAPEHVPHGLFWDTDDPYHYIRAALTSDGPVVIVGGEDHRTGTDGENEAFECLEQYCRQRFDVHAIVRRWSGQIMEPVDGLPYIGPRQEGSRVYIATGYAGDGMTFGTVAAQLLTALVRGLNHPCAEVYAPNRILAARQWAKYAAQNLPAAWTLVSEMVPHPRATSFDDLQPGEGRIVRFNGEKVAASRDRQGMLHIVSPTCTHMGCDVVWNTVEQTWDCPCHGSRYGADGPVLHGPATAPLEPLGAFVVVRGTRTPPQP